MSQKILITGITGFVGSHMADYILKSGNNNYEIFGTKRYHLSRMDKVEHFFDKITWYDCDFTDPISTEKVINEIKPDKIFHFAAESFVSPSWDHPNRYMNVNYNATLNILEALRKTKSKAKILIPGSGEEYGELEESDMPIKDNTVLKPVNPYAVTKIAQDLIAYVYFKSYGINVIRCRTFNHEGPRREHVFGLSSHAYQIAKIEAGLQDPTILVGHLKDKRNFTHVVDIVEAYWLAAEHCQVGKLYLIGNESEDSIFTFEEALEKLKSLSKVKNLKHKEHKPFVRYTNVPFLIVDTSEFFNLTGWKPKISFEQILQDTLNYWRGVIKKKLVQSYEKSN